MQRCWPLYLTDLPLRQYTKMAQMVSLDGRPFCVILFYVLPLVTKAYKTRLLWFMTVAQLNCVLYCRSGLTSQCFLGSLSFRKVVVKLWPVNSFSLFCLLRKRITGSGIENQTKTKKNVLALGPQMAIQSMSFGFAVLSHCPSGRPVILMIFFSPYIAFSLLSCTTAGLKINKKNKKLMP